MSDNHENANGNGNLPPVSEALGRIVDDHDGREDISIEELMQSLHERGFGLLMAVLVLPNCVPVPIPPGMSTVFSIPLLFLSTQMLIGLDHPWLPLWLRRKRVGHGILARAVRIIAPKMRWLEKFLRPRLSFASSKTGERVVGLFWLIFALDIAVPLPATNFVPGISTLVMALGLLNKDGVVMLIGAVIGSIYTVILMALGTSAMLALLSLGG